MSPDIHTLTGAYAADALEDDERRFFEQHLDVCSACAQEVRELQATAARLGAAIAGPPPPELRARVMGEVDQTRQTAPRRPGGVAVRGPQRRWIFVVPAAVLVILAVVGVGVIAVDGLGDGAGDGAETGYAEIMAAPDAQWVEDRGADGSMGRAVVSASRGVAFLMVDAMEPAPADHTYALWVVDDEGMTSAARFDVGDSGRWSRVVTADFADAAALCVTVEPMAGGTEPSSEPVVWLDLAS